MSISMTRGAFVDSVAQAICTSGLVRMGEYGVSFAEQICRKMGFYCAPTVEVEIDCRWLWREFFELHQFNETPVTSESYADLARTMLREVVSVSLSSSQCPVTAAADEYVAGILEEIKELEPTWPELDASEGGASNDDPGQETGTHANCSGRNERKGGDK